MSAATPSLPSTEPAVAPAAWPDGTRVGYVVAPHGGGRPVRMAVKDDGTLEVEGIGTYRILETVPLDERRGG